MKRFLRADRDERIALLPLRNLADQAFSRTAGAALIDGNHARILRDAHENYPAWLNAIAAAREHIHLENYIFADDPTGQEFADALIAKAQAGVTVRLLYDWLGNFRKASRRFWQRMQNSGIEVRCYNPPQLSSPLGWLSRDHRKLVAVDGQVAFVSGLCIAQTWQGNPERGLAPWRDTGVEIRGPAVLEVEQAFARTWAATGEPIPAEEPITPPPVAGDMNIRIVATEPATAGMLRVDLLIAAMARKRLWLTDAYYAGTTSYVEALRAAAKDGVDVRLLLPNTTDIPLLQPLSRSGYRPLLEAGVRIFEWNGTMLHAKTAVADGHWARVGSTNLNVASWLGNYELDAILEDSAFGSSMEEMYLQDLENATEVVLNQRRRLHSSAEPRLPYSRSGSGNKGSVNRAAAGAARIGHTIGAALTDRRVLGPIEARLAAVTGLLLCLLSIFFALFPKVLAYPLIALGIWGGLVLLYRGYVLARKQRPSRPTDQQELR